MIILIFFITTASSYSFLLRSEVAAFFLCIAIFFLLFWNKSHLVNLILIATGYIIGIVGYDQMNGNILTFGNKYLSGGIPDMSFLFGIYMFPRLYQMIQQTKVKKPILGKVIRYRPHFFSMLRGGAVGSILGLVPFIGPLLNSNVSYDLENFFHKKKNSRDALKRVTAAETANNAGQVTVLIPLLVLGLAIQPSEIILLQLIESQIWTVAQTYNWKFLALLYISIPVGCFFTAFLCYNVVKTTMQFFYTHIQLILYSILVISVSSILYMGFQADQTMYYFIVLCVSIAIGLVLEKKKVDVLPLIIIFLLENNYSDVIKRIMVMYL
jgi:TctA family transporter